MEVKSEYLETKQEDLPLGWLRSTLGSHSTFRTGPFGSALHQSDYVRDGVPVVNPMQIVDGRIEPTPSMSITEQAARRLSDFRLATGDLVIARRGEMGRCAVVRAEHNGWLCGTGSMIIRTRPSLDPEFTQRLLSSRPVIKAIESSSVGSTMTNLNQRTVSELNVTIPESRAEQEAIAGVLNDADALIESLEQLLTKRHKIKQGAMQELLTGTRRLPGFIAPWTPRRIAEAARPCTQKNDDGHKLAVLTCSKHRGFVDSLRYFKNQVFSDDTRGYRIIRRGELGYPSNHVEEGSIGLQDLYDVALVSPIYVVFSAVEGVDSYFLHRVLKLDSYRRRFAVATSSSVDRRGSLRWPTFSNIEVLLPKPEEQMAIVAVLQAMEGELRTLDEGLVKARLLRQGMMQNLMTGKIRLL